MEGEISVLNKSTYLLIKVAEHSFQLSMPNSPLLLNCSWFGSRFLQESRLTIEEFIIAFRLGCVLFPWHCSWLKRNLKNGFRLFKKIYSLEIWPKSSLETTWMIYQEESEFWHWEFLILQKMIHSESRKWPTGMSKFYFVFMRTVLTEGISCKLVVGKRWKNLTNGFF